MCHASFFCIELWRFLRIVPVCNFCRCSERGEIGTNTTFRIDALLNKKSISSWVIRPGCATSLLSIGRSHLSLILSRWSTPLYWADWCSGLALDRLYLIICWRFSINLISLLNSHRCILLSCKFCIYSSLSLLHNLVDLFLVLEGDDLFGLLLFLFLFEMYFLTMLFLAAHACSLCGYKGQHRSHMLCRILMCIHNPCWFLSFSFCIFFAFLLLFL